MKVSGKQVQRIAEEAAYAAPPDDKRSRTMDQFEQLARWPWGRRLFEAHAPEYVAQLLAYIDQIDDAIRSLPPSIADDVVDRITAQEEE